VSLRRTPLVLAALAALLVCAAPAGAARTEVVKMPVFAPQLVTDGVVFFSRARGEARVIHAAPGQAPATIATLDDPPSADPECCTLDYDTGIAAEGGHAAVSRHVVFFAKGLLAEDSFSLRAGPVGAPLPEIYACAGSHAFDVDGGRIAYVDGCGSGGGPNSPVVVRDLTAPNAPVIHNVPVTGTTGGIRLAGQHLAISRIVGDNVEVGVHDLGAGSEAYKAAADSTLLALQADGKLLVRETVGSSCRLAWYSKAEPVPHRIEVCPVEGVRFAADRIALGRETGGSAVSIDLMTLDGQSTTAASFAAGSLLNGFDFDGTRLGYGVAGCSSPEDRVYIDDLTGPPPPTEGGPCPASISKSSVRSTSSGKVTVRFECPGGCSGFLTIRRGGAQIVRSVAFLNDPPGTRKATMRLTNSARRLLRERGSLVVQARLQADQRGPSPRTFKRAIRLLAPK
jgi:hypothetical protein